NRCHISRAAQAVKVRANPYSVESERSPSPQPSPPRRGRSGRPLRNDSPVGDSSQRGERNPHAHEPRGTSNIEHPTPNIEWQRFQRPNYHFGQSLRVWRGAAVEFQHTRCQRRGSNTQKPSPNERTIGNLSADSQRIVAGVRRVEGERRASWNVRDNRVVQLFSTRDGDVVNVESYTWTEV